MKPFRRAASGKTAKSTRRRVACCWGKAKNYPSHETTALPLGATGGMRKAEGAATAPLSMALAPIRTGGFPPGASKCRTELFRPDPVHYQYLIPGILSAPVGINTSPRLTEDIVDSSTQILLCSPVLLKWNLRTRCP